MAEYKPIRHKEYEIEGNKDFNDLIFEAITSLPLTKSQKRIKKLFREYEVDIYNTMEGEYLTLVVGDIKLVSRNPNTEGIKTYDT